MKDSSFKHFNPMALREKYTAKNTNSNFWFDDSPRTSIFDEDNEEVKRGVDHIQLASYRRAIANFVTIVTGDSTIPVKFQSNDQSFTDGKVVTIGSKINERSFDPTVGVALHEGSHIKLSNFDFLRNLEFEIPQFVYELGEEKGFDNYTVRGHIKNMLNYVEDRRIDWYVFSTSPGYKGYYNSMYDKYFHSKVIDKALRTDEYTSLDWDSYQFRILNLTNKNSRLDVLPELSLIYNMIFKHNGGVKKMTSTRDAFRVAKEIVQTIYSILPDGVKEKNEYGDEKTKTASDVVKDGGSESLSDSEFEDLKEQLENGSLSSGDEGDKVELTEKQMKSLERAFQKQKDFVDGNIKKTGKLSKKDSGIIKSMEDAGVDMKKVGTSLNEEIYDYHSGDYVKVPHKGLDCIFVKKITDQMIQDYVFPALFTSYHYRNKFGEELPIHIQEMLTDAVTLGKKLGRKLQIRGESRDTKWSRLDSGRIDKRLISELGFGNDRVFSTTFVEKFSDAFLHISIDASGSMNGEKWRNTMVSTIAICKAASMIDNVDVVVSFRTTHESGRTYRNSSNLPLIAIGYDSRVDKFSKVLRHFPWISPGGTTPEGLCFEAILNEIVPTVRDRDSYFLNFSDGMPMFSGDSLYYYDKTAETHTKKMVDEIRKKGVKVLSYFIGDEYGRDRNMESFKTMYGKDASFINVTNVMEVSKSMNKMFLEKSNG